MRGRTPQEVASAALVLLLEVVGGTAGAVYFEDEQTRGLRCLAVVGVPAPPSSGLWDRIASRVVHEGRPVSMSARLAIPLKYGRRVGGVLLVQGLPRTGASVKRAGAVTAFAANLLADALDHARLAQKYAQKIDRIRHLEEASKWLNSSGDVREGLRRAIEAAVRLVEAEAGRLLLADEDRIGLVPDVVVCPGGDSPRDAWQRAGKGIATAVMRTGQPFMVNDAERDPRVHGGLSGPAKKSSPFPIRTLLAVPVRSGDRVLGVLETVNKQGNHSFSNWDLTELASLANQVGIVIQNSRLFREHRVQIQRLRQLQQISRLLNSTLDQATIRNRAIEGTMALLEAEAGSLLLLDDATGELYFEVALGEKGEAVREIRLKPGQGIAGHVAKTGQAAIVNDVQRDPRFSPHADKKSGFVTRNMVCAPVSARDRILGILQAINKRDDRPFDQDDLQNLVMLGHQVGIAIENANLYEEINRLLEGFISASVVAIESRDPTTSGHSERVAVLTCGLAELVDRIDRGPYAAVRFDHEQMKEIRYAAVLHDFGKVGVREQVLVKAQKLYPEDLELLKARFNFIKRSFEVRALQRKVDVLLSGDRAATARLLEEIDVSLAREIAETDGILEFLLACNQPTVLQRAGFERLQDIARLTYPSFNGREPYLIPQEVMTLSITKGSLTAEERTQVEEHVTHTYRFLATIPWTKALRNIPQIAYGHHEKLDGTGYPRRVPGESLAVQTRMMTICDIYDALTAADRPYKAAMPVPTALSILADEVKQGKVDAHLFELFVEAKIYRRVCRVAD